MSRETALRRFQERGFPSTRLEDWKYTDLGRVAGIGERWLASGDDEPGYDEASIRRIVGEIDAHWLVVANGRRVDTLSSVDGLAGVAVNPLAIDDDPPRDDRLADLNAAFLEDGVEVRVSADFPADKPLGLLVADSTSGGPRMSQVRVDFRVDPGVELRLLEYHSSTGDDEHYSNVLMNLGLGENASVEMVRINVRGEEDSQTARLDLEMQRDSRFRHSGFDLGGRLVRNDLSIDIAAAGADAAFDGLYIVGEGQHVDNHTRVDHRVGPARSAQEYRGILAGRCRAVWNGKAIVHKGADGTDATQANHNLLLSDNGEIDAKPELEIYADEVKCAHGTTVGQLDESALFYLRSRGLDETTARKALIRAFATSVASHAAVAQIQEHVTALVEDRLATITRKVRA